jgi:predicted nucleic acid-binding protein
MPGPVKIVDSWPVIAWLLSHAAAPRFERLLQEADAARIQLIMSWVNVGEVYYIIARRHGAANADAFLKRLVALPIRTVLPDEQDIIAAARIKASHPMSYADTFAAALALREDAPVITGDPEFRTLPGLKIDWVG